MTKIAHICLGSNFAGADQELAKALAAIHDLTNVKVSAVSRIYLTEPQDYTDQPWFHNQVCRLEVGDDWTAENFLQTLLIVEKNLGRVRSSNAALRFGPRRIDLDLLLFDKERSQTEMCQVPHPRVCQRAFALIPLQEIDPDITINDQPISYWLAKLNWDLRGNLIFQEKSGD